jgi:hypothetical protein
MNVLTTTWRQLVRRRLWPVAVLLVAALAAVPVLLARDPEPVVPSSPTSEAPAESTKVDDVIAEPVVAKASTEDRSRRRRVLGTRKDPFAPDIVKHPPKKAKKKAAKKTEQESTPSTPANTGGSTVPTTPTVPSTPVVPVAPAPPKKTYPKDSVIVRFGDATADTLTRSVVKKLGALPDEDDPVLVYMGLTDSGKKAVFLVDDALEPTGDGDCKPHPSNCETVELAKGETEFFDVIDPETGDVSEQFQLDLVAIK